MRSLLRLFITLLVALRWLIAVLLWCLAFIVLLQFAAQFEHPASWDASWPVVKLEEWGDPLLAMIGSWFFMLEEGDPAVWPADELRYFPIVVIIGAVLLHIGVMKMMVPVIRKALAKKALSSLVQHPGGFGGFGPPPQSGSDTRHTIEGEFRREDD